MNAALRESLYDLWEIGGLELMGQGLNGLKRELLLNIEVSGLDPGQHQIIRYHAVNRWDDTDEFIEYARPSQPLCTLAQEITGITNEQLAHCRMSSAVMSDFIEFIGYSELISTNMDFDMGFINKS